MSLLFVNKKLVDGVEYTALRDSDNPKLEYIKKEDTFVKCRLKEVWNDNVKIKGLF